MAREQPKKRVDEETFDRRDYLRLAGSTATAIVGGTVGAVAHTQSASTSPSIERFNISKSDTLGSNQMFVVKWTISDGNENLDVVEVVVDDGSSNLDFAVEDVNGKSASGWKIFQFPVGSELNIHVRAKDSDGNISKDSKTITLGSDQSSESEADIHVPFDDSSNFNKFTSERIDKGSIVSAPQRDGNALRVPIPQGEHYGCDRRLEFEELTGSEPIEAVARFNLYIPESFQYAEPARGGCKIGGFAGTYGEAGWGDRISDGTNGWSSRMHVADPQELGVDEDLGLMYTIHHASAGLYGDQVYWDVGINKGQWHQIEQYVKLNTPGENNGVVKGWVDGELAYDRKNLLFREDGYNHIKMQDFWLNVYHGGSWTSPSDTAIYMDNLKIKRDAGSL